MVKKVKKMKRIKMSESKKRRLRMRIIAKASNKRIKKTRRKRAAVAARRVLVVADLDEVDLAFALFRKIDVSESTMLDVIVRLKKMIEMHK